jgi:hypothetical protein
MMKWLKAIFCAAVIIPWMLSAEEVKEERSDEKRTDAKHLLEVIEGQLSAVRRSQLEDAYNNFTSEEFKGKTTYENFKEVMDKFAVFKNNKSFQFGSEYFEDGIATLQGSLISSDGEVLQVEYDLVREKGNWKIQGIQLFKPEATVSRPEN